MAGALNRRDFLKLASASATAPFLLWRNEPRGAPALSSQATPQPNVLMVVFDTLSARHMSLYGYPRSTTPQLAQLAKRATVYHAHRSTGNFTSPGTASLLTGMYPWTHRAFNHSGNVADDLAQRNIFGFFSASGYSTLAYSHNYMANYLLMQVASVIDDLLDPRSFSIYNGEVASAFFGSDRDTAYRSLEDLILRRGELPSSMLLSLVDRLRLALLKKQQFGSHASSFPRGLPELFKMAFVLEDVVDGIVDASVGLREPFFAYFHILPPHEPYRPRREYVDLFRDGWDPPSKPSLRFSEGIGDHKLKQLHREYDEYLAYADAEFGRLFRALESSGVLENTYLVFTSDHGQLFERGVHGHITQLLYEPLLHVPLIIWPPGQHHRWDVRETTASVDVLPTLLHLTGQPVPDWCEGQVLPPFSGGGISVERPIYSMECKQNRKMAPIAMGTLSCTVGNHKLIRYLGYHGQEGVELYDLSSDPDEVEDLSSAKPTVARELEAKLRSALAGTNARFLA